MLNVVTEDGGGDAVEDVDGEDDDGDDDDGDDGDDADDEYDDEEVAGGGSVTDTSV